MKLNDLLDAKEYFDMRLNLPTSSSPVSVGRELSVWRQTKRQTKQRRMFEIAKDAIESQIKSNVARDAAMDDADFGAICVCAERYACGRQTYMPRLVQDYIKRNISAIDDRAINVMLNDLSHEVSFGDPQIDKPGWMQFKEFLKEELERRTKE